MQTKQLLKALDEGLVEKLYGFCYARCGNYQDAKDLCQEILLQLVKAEKKNRTIENFGGYCWKVAHNVYADFCEKRSRDICKTTDINSVEVCEQIQENTIEQFFEEEDERQKLKHILAEIAALGKAYREVMVLYYLEEKKVAEIAHGLNIAETTVKQRLFAARTLIREEVRQEKPYRDVEPVHFYMCGIGCPAGNNPWVQGERQLSKRVLVSCKKKAKSAKEFAAELGVPMVFMEDELEILCKGQNGSYGLLRRTGKKKYISNVILFETKDFQNFLRKTKKSVQKFLTELEKFAAEKKPELKRIPKWGMGRQDNYANWVFLTETMMLLYEKINRCMERELELSGREKKPYTAMALKAECEPCSYEQFETYGYNKFVRKNIGQYRQVIIQCLYGKRVNSAFVVRGERMDAEMLVVLKALEGIRADALGEEEKEAAAKAIADNYLIKKGEWIYPCLFVTDTGAFEQLHQLIGQFLAGQQQFLEELAAVMSAAAEKIVPGHLREDVPEAFALLFAGMQAQLIEEGIKTGFLSEPQYGTEGMSIVVEK